MNIRNVDNLKAYYVSGVADNIVNLTAIDDVIPANTGVLLKGIPATYLLQVAYTENVIEHNMLKGVTEETKVESVSEGCQNYVLTKRDGKAVFLKVEPTGRLFQSGKSYLSIPIDGLSEAKQFYGLSFDDAPNDIESIKSSMGNIDIDIYDLSGRMKRHPSKGINIIKNKKVFYK